MKVPCYYLHWQTLIKYYLLIRDLSNPMYLCSTDVVAILCVTFYVCILFCMFTDTGSPGEPTQSHSEVEKSQSLVPHFWCPLSSSGSRWQQGECGRTTVKLRWQKSQYGGQDRWWMGPATTLTWEADGHFL